MRLGGRGMIERTVVARNGPAKLSASVAQSFRSLLPIGESSTANVVDQHVHVTDPPDHVLGNEGCRESSASAMIRSTAG